MKFLCGLILSIFLAVAVTEAQNPAALPTPLPVEEECALTDPELIKLNISAWSKNKGYLKDLTYKDFEFFDGKTKKWIEFFKKQDEPISVGILFDLSDSISPREIPAAVDGLISFINDGNPQNEYFIIAFAREVGVLLEPTQNKKEIEAALKILLTEKMAGNTSVYDAMNKGFAKIAGGKFERKVLLAISDGVDNNSDNSFGDLKKLARQNSDVTVYQIDILTDTNELTRLETMQAMSFFETLTENTGGRAFQARTRGQTINAFEMLAEELKNQYIIGIYPESAAEEKNWHEVKINLNLPKETKGDTGKVLIRAPKGFYF